MSAVRPISEQIARTIDADVLIIGSGLAGLMLALKLCQNQTDKSRRLVLVSKSKLSDSNSSWAQGGVAAVTGANPFDSPEAHYIDTIKSGAGLTDPTAAREIVDGGGRLIKELASLGVNFDKTGAGKLDLALEGGHKQARVIHSKDTTGLSITSALCLKLREAQKQGLITILEDTIAIDLLTSNISSTSHKNSTSGNCSTSNNNAVCHGAKLLDDNGAIYVNARRTVLATGGLGQIFERTTNPSVATGDGVAIAYRAGAQLMDMEFVQFHPTALKLDNAPAFLISEAVRGAGATLLDHTGERFVQRYHPDGELATRDVVSRAIHAVMSENNLDNVYLDLGPIGVERIAAKFPNIVATCAQYGIDALTQPIPVAPAAHYMMGGIKTNTTGQTTIPGLYAIGECACTGLHGANRLASNSLLEAGVMALNLSSEIARADAAAADYSEPTLADHALNRQHPAALLLELPLLVPTDLKEFQKQMYRQAGMVRSKASLEEILQTPCLTVQTPTKSDFAARNILLLGQLVAKAALLREESRGSHLRDDFREINDNKFDGHFWISKAGTSWVASKPGSLVDAVIQVSPVSSISSNFASSY
ncbi:MAG: L-aspartate oxidase [Candidatus Obscuribacter sp.]|nr:L-aspartate oxidase [Candidatus Obscuribacter sp.]